MRKILGAFALVIAAPAVAQGTPAPDQHAGHAQHEEHRGERHEGHDGDHKMDCCKDCCDKMKHEGHSMEHSGTHREGASGEDHSQHGN